MTERLILCATARLAQTLRGAAPPGAEVWRTPRALTIAQWLGSLADEASLSGAASLPQALEPFAELLQWEQVIATALPDNLAPLFDIQGMARSAAEAHALTRIWKLPPAAAPRSDEASLFIGWQTEFIKRCRAGGRIDLPGLHRQVIALLEDGHFTLPECATFAGFDRLTPLETDLMTTLAARGVAVENRPPAAVDRSTRRALRYADSDAECAAIAAWARQRLAADPACRLGIVTPDLAAQRNRLEFRLDDALHPALIRPDAAEAPRCFNFSLGQPLAELPLIRIALDLLALGSGRGKVEQRRLSELLLSGGWSAAEAEADDRAQLDATLRRNLPYFTTLPALIRLARRLAESRPPLCPRTVAALDALVAAASSATRKLPPGQWAGIFGRCLNAAGWPGERSLSSHEYQARRAFAEVLDGFGQLAGVLGPLPFGEAVRRLSQLCRQRIFQPETRGRPAIQVLGVLESGGLDFDALWVMSMNDDLWPPPPRPNPLLPAELQRATGTAHASAEVELDFAQRVHARLLLAAPDVTFSCSLADGNRMLRPSPLIAGIPLADENIADVLSVARQLAAEAGAAREQVPDGLAPAVAEGERVSGGSWLLRAQAICPAWAYYQYRLGGEALEEAVEGLDPAARGTLVHEALEALWTALRSSEALAELDEAGRHQAIAEAVAKALQNFERERRVTLPTRFRGLEAARLARLLDLWLRVESKRVQPFEVIACEQSAAVEIEEIRVKVVVDRIDRLSDGRQVIIDYKTGAAIDTRNWSAQRITEPQLPIYAALVADDVSAVVFAKVVVDKPGFAGVADDKDILPGVQAVGDGKQRIFDPVEFPDWIAVVTHWRERLHAVAAEVKTGVAGVSFADEKALKYCEVLPLLRLPERRRLLAAARAEEAP